MIKHKEQDQRTNHKLRININDKEQYQAQIANTKMKTHEPIKIMNTKENYHATHREQTTKIKTNNTQRRTNSKRRPRQAS